MLRIFKKSNLLKHPFQQSRAKILKGIPKSMLTNHIKPALQTVLILTPPLLFLKKPIFFLPIPKKKSKKDKKFEEKLKSHKDYNRLINELKSLITTEEKIVELTKIQLEKICSIVITIAADDYISKMHDFNRERKSFFKANELSNEYVKAKNGMILKRRGLIEKYTSLVLADIGVSYEDWKASFLKNNGFKTKEINPFEELKNLEQISQKSKNIDIVELEKIYEVQISTLNDLAGFFDREFYEKLKGVKLPNEEVIDIMMEVYRLMHEDVINNSTQTSPGDGLYSGHQCNPKIIELQGELEEELKKLENKLWRLVNKDINE